MNSEEELSEENILERIARYADNFTDISYQIHSVDPPHNGSAFPKKKLEITILDGSHVHGMVEFLIRMYDFFWTNILAVEKQYQNFIQNVPEKIKQRSPATDNYITFRVKLPHSELYSSLINNINRIYPKLFVFVSIEEVYDGWLVFLNEKYDFTSFIQEIDDVNLGEKWLKNNGFILPLEFYTQSFQMILNFPKSHSFD